MPRFIIQDLEIGYIQHISGEVFDEAAALHEFNALVGLGDTSVDEWRITQATTEMVAEAEAWSEAGHPAHDAPAWS